MATGTVTLRDDLAEVIIVPGVGAGIASYDFVTGQAREPLFRPCRDVANAGPFDLACNLLVPWSNRISGGGFSFKGRFYALQPNLASEPCPIHGNGFSSKWKVSNVSTSSATLCLSSTGPGPYVYDAAITYALEGQGALQMTLIVVNRGPRLPFGLGFHPWLPRTHDVLLQAPASMIDLEDKRHLPSGSVPVGERPDWDFSCSAPLPAAWINNAFTGWNGRARIIWPARHLALEIQAGPIFSACILYSPSAEADYFCFEPVSHRVDAHNFSGGEAENGLTVLAGGERLSGVCRFIPSTKLVFE